MASAAARHKRRIGRGGAGRLVAHVLLVTVTASSCGGNAPPPDARGQAAPVTAAAAPPSAPPRAIAPEAAVKLPAAPKLESYDWIARTEALGAGVQPSFDAVRNEIRFEVYSGTLRGPEVTYATRAGNAFDRSRLLAAMLKRKGIRTRYALGTLPAPRAEQLVARTFEGGMARTDQSPGSDLMTRVVARAREDYTAMKAAIPGGPPAVHNTPRAELAGEAAKHAWVQALVDGRWIDLDSSFPDAAPGSTYGAVEQTPDDLPDSVRQRVTVRVVAESIRGSAVERATALEWSAAAEDVVDEQVILIHRPAGGSGVAGGIAAAIEPDAWRPLLWVDGALHEGATIKFTESQPRASGGGPPRGGLGGIFGRGGALASGGAQFVSEWVEFEILFPGGRRDLTRRVLVDRRDPTAPRAGQVDAARLQALPRNQHGPLAVQSLHAIWFTAGRHNLSDFTAAAEIVSGLAAKTAVDGPPDQSDFGLAVWPFAIGALGMMVVSDHAVVPMLNDDQAYRFYPDSPRILIVSAGPLPNGRSQLAYDLRRDAIRGVAKDEAGAAEVARRKLWFGALEGALEEETARAFARAAGAKDHAVMTTSGLRGGRPLVAVDRTSADFPGGEDDVAVLVPSAAAARPRGWWAIGPQGDVVAVLDGLHAIMHDFDPRIGGSRPGTGTTWHIELDKSGRPVSTSRSSRFSSPRPAEKKTAPHEYLMMIATISVAVVLTGYLMVAFWSEVMVPTLSGQVTAALEADARFR